MTLDNPMATRQKSYGSWWTFAVSATAAFIAALDLAIVNVAFAEIARSFPGVSRATISWVVTSYSIVFGSLLVVSGRLADRLGRRRIFLQGTALFLLGSVACAAAPNMAILILGRAIQGAGGAMMTPASMGLLLGAFPIQKRSQVVAWTAAVGALGVASGPTLGALVISVFGWRSAFWVNVPICIAVMVITLRVVRESPKQDSRTPDIAASFLLTLGVGALVWSISRVEETSWSDTGVLALAAVAVVLGVAVWRRSLSHPEPLLPPELFRERSFTVANMSSLLFGAAFSGNILNNVLFLRTIWEYSLVRAGLFSVLSPIVVAVVSMLVGRSLSKIGFRPLLIAGPLIFAVTTITQSFALHDTPQPWTRWLPLMFLLGLSIGATFPVLSAAAVFRLPQTRFALGGAINNTFRQIGAAIGVALVVSLQAAADGVDGFHHAWRVCAVLGLATAVVSTAQPRQRAGDDAATPGSAPADASTTSSVATVAPALEG